MVLGLTMTLLLGTAGFRLPLKLMLSATLTGTAIYQVCPASGVPLPLDPCPCPQACVGSDPAQLSKNPAHSPVQLPLAILGMVAYPEDRAFQRLSAHTESELEFWSHINMDLNPSSIIYLLCDLGQVTQHP